MRSTGKHNDYYWAEWTSTNAFLSDLIAAVPEMALGKRMINTSFDSGELGLSEEDYEKGWTKLGVLTISPPVLEIREIPYDQYDEWYIFEALPDLLLFSRMGVFINDSRFQLRDAADPAIQAVQDRFWEQLDRIAPETYAAEGANVLLATRSQAIYEQALRWVERK